ncbi:hypothetical protein ACFL35_00590 [Candidatus Riflebacteria bacterium]
MQNGADTFFLFDLEECTELLLNTGDKDNIALVEAIKPFIKNIDMPGLLEFLQKLE